MIDVFLWNQDFKSDTIASTTLAHLVFFHFQFQTQSSDNTQLDSDCLRVSGLREVWVE
jgi:hypothetical protein